MDNILIWDIIAIVCIGLAFLALYYQVRAIRKCKDFTRFAIMFEGIATIWVIIMFLSSLLRLNGDFRIVPELGRSAFVLLIMALVIAGMIHVRRGEC